MYRTLRSTCAAAALTATLAVPASGAEISRYQSRGDGVETYLYDVDPTGCVVTEVWLSLREGRRQVGTGPGERSTRIEFAGYDYDACQDYYLTGFQVFTTVPAHAFHTSGLVSASLQATIPVELIGVAGARTVPVIFDLVWTGEGERSGPSFNIQRHRHPDFTYMSRTSGRARNAAVTGSITLESRNLMTGSTGGSLWTQQDSFTTIQRDPVAALAPSPLALSLARPETTSYTSRGNSAVARFSEVDPTGCVQTETALFVKEGRMRAEPGPVEPSTSIDFFTYDYNACNREYTLVLHGFTAVPADAVHFRGQGLQSASLQVTIPVEHHLADGTVTTVPVSFDLVWTGEGDVSRGLSIYRNGHRGFSYMTRSSGSSRDATISGSILWGSRNLAAFQETSASLEYHQESVTTRHGVQRE